MKFNTSRFDKFILKEITTKSYKSLETLLIDAKQATHNAISNIMKHGLKNFIGKKY